MNTRKRLIELCDKWRLEAEHFGSMGDPGASEVEFAYRTCAEEIREQFVDVPKGLPTETYEAMYEVTKVMKEMHEARIEELTTLIMSLYEMIGDTPRSGVMEFIEENVPELFAVVEEDEAEEE